MLTTFLSALVLAQVPAIIPMPAHLTPGEGVFKIKYNTLIVGNGLVQDIINDLNDELSPALGYRLPNSAQPRQSNYIRLILKPNPNLGPEGYDFTSTSDGVTIQAPTKAGLFYGVQTLRQLLPTSIFQRVKSQTEWTVPAVQIEDQPRFAWRGAMLDVSRHFMPKEFLFKFVDLLALHKLNTFHLHLTDSQGWRIQIKKYPKLTEVGAWHKANDLTNDPTTWKTRPDGGFYTQDDLRQLVAYAAKRFITIVPEIEMPGHSTAAIVSYPELGNTGKQTQVPGVNDPDVDSALNVSDNTIKFYQDVLTEVLDIFPSKFIHVGGDEVDKKYWHDNPAMQARMQQLGLKNEEELQSWFIRQMDQFLSGHGRRLIGWDEILQGGLAPGATVMSWRGINGGIAAAQANHDVVMAPGDFTYLDHYQSKDHTKEPRAIGGFLPLETVYGYDPIPNALTPDQAKHILGAQGQLWTEYIPNPKHVEYMAYPRLCALSEATWTPLTQKDYSGFLNRLQTHLERLDLLDVAYRPLDPR